jgi:cytochrome c-type biogenesis protein
MSSTPSVIAAFGAGLISFLSPCVLPLVPSYLALISGTHVSRRKTVIATLGFIGGFTLIFCLLGAGASTIGGWLLTNQQTLQRISGLIIIFFGLMMTGVATIPALQRERRFHVDPAKYGVAGPTIMGMAFAFGWTPCIGPILGPILALAATTETVWSGVSLLFVYSLGLGVPFFVSALAIDKLATTFGWVKRHYRPINAVAGSIMVIFGIVLFTGNLGQISLWFTDLLEAIGLKRLTTI